MLFNPILLPLLLLSMRYDFNEFLHAEFKQSTVLLNCTWPTRTVPQWVLGQAGGVRLAGASVSMREWERGREGPGV